MGEDDFAQEKANAFADWGSGNKKVLGSAKKQNTTDNEEVRAPWRIRQTKYLERR